MYESKDLKLEDYYVILDKNNLLEPKFPHL